VQARPVGKDERDAAGAASEGAVGTELEIHPEVDQRPVVLQREAVDEPTRGEVVGAAEDDVAVGKAERDVPLQRRRCQHLALVAEAASAALGDRHLARRSSASAELTPTRRLRLVSSTSSGSTTSVGTPR
jgi:hypothetical protein